MRLICSLSLPLSLLLTAAPLGAQIPTIVEEIGQLESVRDPKCYATASRLEDFIYGTPLDTDARFEKISLQKAILRHLWVKATTATEAAGKTQIEASLLRPLLREVVPYEQAPDGNWIVVPGEPARATTITARDNRQYGSVAYALRALLAVQQDALVDGTRLLPLEPAAVGALKQWLDLTTLAVLQRADEIARRTNQSRVGAAALRSAWNTVVKTAVPPSPPPAATPTPAGAEKFATIKAIVDEKLAAFEAYNTLSMTVFLRNLQVYMARHLWPADPEEGAVFRDTFNETMIAWTADVILESERHAKESGQALIRVEHVHEAVQRFQPHELNEYEDCIYFPRFPRNERIVIEAYDLDSFRDPGLHWFYLSEVLKDPGYEGTIELDPFAAELLTEGAAQMGTLILRVAGTIAQEEGAERLAPGHLSKSLERIQSMLDRHAAIPLTKKAPAAIASAPTTDRKKGTGHYFTDATAASGIEFQHRMSDWLARFIRGYTVLEGNVVRLAVPPAFGGSGIAAEDIDGDGHIDLLILSGSGNALYLNDGKGRFTDVTAASGLVWRRPDGTFGEPRQPIIADFDNDGLQDIVITYADDDHRLYKGLGGGRFEDVTARSNLGGKGLIGGPATALDFDRDGLLDLYIGYFGDFVRGELPTLARRNTNGLPNKLFRNKGNMVFEDVTAGSGVDNSGWTQAVGHLDFDGDGWQDLICGNDFGVNAWYRNRGDGTFEDVSSHLGTDKPSYTLGIGITDLNRDGYPDIYISNIVTMDKDEKYVLPGEKTRMKFNPEKMAHMRVVEANDLFVSRGESGRLVSYELSSAVGRGFRSTGWSWGADFFDFDNDGDDDLYVANGMNEYALYSSVNPYFTDASDKPRDIIMPVAEKEMNVFFVNRDGQLSEASEQSGTALVGNSRSVAYFDADGDGDLDMVVNNLNGPAVFYRNNTSSRNRSRWIKIRLTGDPEKGVTRDAIGAVIVVDTARHKGLWRQVSSTNGYLTSNPKQQHLGLGADDRADVTVIWPNGERQTFKGLRANRSHTLVQGQESSD
ncbi:MAG TPA: CRTAC1 family protein [Thermoanaerobaculia bacterium]|nr:CRTAC1 family protein [Thermoanaerobaculia bacterium]